MLANSMETVAACNLEVIETGSKKEVIETENKREVIDTESKREIFENASDRESSIESFHTNKSETSITTETELIDLEDIELSDEESWLYKSPKKMPSEPCKQKLLQKDVDDMDEEELKSTRNALLNKLNNLKLLNSDVEQRVAKKDLKESKLLCDHEHQKPFVSAPENHVNQPKSEENIAPLNNMKTESSVPSQDWKSSQVFDVMDVQKIARLQEESLKQSSYRFLNQPGKKMPGSRDLSPVSPAQAISLNKPASVEALNTCSEKANLSNVYGMVPLQGIKKQSMFGSASSLNCSPEFHRGSLPNINKGYNSLKARKSKRPSEPKVSCPLPKYPSHSKVSINGSGPQPLSDFQNKSQSPSYDHREARTLPSSYRVHSRSNSSSRRDVSALSPSPRRETVPYLGNYFASEPNQRENHRKFSSPVPTTVYPRYNSSYASVSPTKVFNAQQQNLRSPPSTEYHRATSHSPSRRLPLSTVQHQSPKKRNSLASVRNGEIRTLPSKVPSKIPSPALRSGIPVPSSFASRANGDDTWNQDCF